MDAAESFARSKTRSAHITPAATDEEAAAIAAAVEALWPRPVITTNGGDRRPNVWKFSGRWWSQPIPLRRARPWV